MKETPPLRCRIRFGQFPLLFRDTSPLDLGLSFQNPPCKINTPAPPSSPPPKLVNESGCRPITARRGSPGVPRSSHESPSDCESGASKRASAKWSPLGTPREPSTISLIWVRTKRRAGETVRRSDRKFFGHQNTRDAGRRVRGGRRAGALVPPCSLWRPPAFLPWAPLIDGALRAWGAPHLASLWERLGFQESVPS